MMRRSACVAPLVAVLWVSGCPEPGSVLTIYSPHGRDQLEVFKDAFEAANPGAEVQWVDMGSQEVLDRIRSEQANPQADVWYGGTEDLFGRAAAEGLLEPYRPSWAESVPPEARGPDDLYFGVYFTPAVITFNSDVLSRVEAPQDWDEVLDPRWEGSVIVRDPMPSGTMRMIFQMIMYRGLEATGDTAAGYEWLRRLDAQTKEYVLNPAILYQKLARQEGLVTLWNLPDVLRVQAQGFPLDYVIPTSGTPVSVDAIAIVKGAESRALAEAFIEFVGSVGGQLLAVKSAYRSPTRTDLPVDSLPDWLIRVNEELRPMELDWDLLEARGREWMRYWDTHIRGAG